MKRIKAVNGYTIYEATARDENKYNVEEGMFYIYFSSDIRDYGLAYSYIEMEASSIEEAEAFCMGSKYAIAKEIVEAQTTVATYEEIAAVEKVLDGGSFGEYLEIAEDIDTELIIGDCEMEASFVWYGDIAFTEYGKRYYAPILNAKFKYTPDYIEIFCDDYELGHDFVMTLAGYTSETRYNKIICTK